MTGRAPGYEDTSLRLSVLLERHWRVSALRGPLGAIRICAQRGRPIQSVAILSDMKRGIYEALITRHYARTLSR